MFYRNKKNEQYEAQPLSTEYRENQEKLGKMHDAYEAHVRNEVKRQYR